MSDDGDCSDLICRRRVQVVDKSGIEATTGPYGVRMRWAALFADMELQLDAADARGRDQDVADLTRAERASVLLADRVRACVGGDLRLALRDGTTVAGTVRDVGPVWLLLADNAREHLVPLASVATVAGLGELSAPSEGAVLRRLGLGQVDPGAGLGVHPGDVCLQLVHLDPPLPGLALSADLDRRQLAAANQGVGLLAGDVQDLGDVRQGQEALRHDGSLACPTGRGATVHKSCRTGRSGHDVGATIKARGP